MKTLSNSTQELYFAAFFRQSAWSESRRVPTFRLFLDSKRFRYKMAPSWLHPHMERAKAEGMCGQNIYSFVRCTIHCSTSHLKR